MVDHNYNPPNFQYFIAVVNEHGDVIMPPIHEDDKRARDYDLAVQEDPWLTTKVFVYKLVQ